MNIGLALSGGGVRGIAHIGAIKALEEHGIFPTHIAGTSAGAIVGALYANGNTWKEILDFFKRVEIFRINKFARNKPGLIDTEKLYDSFMELLVKDDFSALQKPLFITATNILDGTLKIFNEGELIRPILASAAFPGIFTPVKIKDEYYIDGGTLNNFPVDLIKPHCDQIIGIYVNPFGKVKIEDMKYSYNVLERAYKIRTANEFISKFPECDMVICPKGLNNFSTFSMKDMDTVFDIGYNAAKEEIKNNTNFVFKRPEVSS
ncbi:MAG: patatin-like phospholipase family protein [Maribacter sp.]|nr:patatin-like phospholipase family protein [Maribacter sp.]